MQIINVGKSNTANQAKSLLYLLMLEDNTFVVPWDDKTAEARFERSAEQKTLKAFQLVADNPPKLGGGSFRKVGDASHNRLRLS